MEGSREKRLSACILSGLTGLEEGCTSVALRTNHFTPRYDRRFLRFKWDLRLSFVGRIINN